MSKLTVTDLKNFLRLDAEFTEDDVDLAIMLSAAYGYLKNGGVDLDAIDISTDQETKDQIKLSVQLLVTHWYENRSAVAVGTITKELEFSLSSLMGQLRWWAPDPEVEA